MKYRFSAEEIGFISIMFEHPLPLLVKEPFVNTTSQQMKKKWMAFIEKFSASEFLRVNNNEEIRFDEKLEAMMMCCFGAENVISIIENEEIRTSFYLLEEKRMRITSIENDLYILEFFDQEEEFRTAVFSTIQLNDRETSLSESFQLKITANQFESLLNDFEKKKSKKIKNLCLEYHVKYEICQEILEEIHRPNSITILTERINRPGTILTKVSNYQGGVRLVKTTYTENGDNVLISQCKKEQIIHHLLDYMER